MDVLQTEGIRLAFLGIKADRNPLHGADIVNGALLVKVCQRDVPGFLIEIDRRDRCRNLLDQRQMFFLLLFIGPVEQFLKCTAPEPS